MLRFFTPLLRLFTPLSPIIVHSVLFSQIFSDVKKSPNVVSQKIPPGWVHIPWCPFYWKMWSMVGPMTGSPSIHLEHSGTSHPSGSESPHPSLPVPTDHRTWGLASRPIGGSIEHQEPEQPGSWFGGW